MSRGAVSLALALACASGCGPEPVATRGPPADAGAPAPPAVTLDRTPAGEVRDIESPADVPLKGHHLFAVRGDWMLSEGEHVAVVSASEGKVIALGERGGPNGLSSIDPTAFDAFDRLAMHVERIDRVEQSRALHVVKRLESKPLVLEQWIYFSDGSLSIESRLQHVGGAEVVAVTLGEVVSWSNTPGWVEGHGFITAGGSYGGAFIARESTGVAYAGCWRDGRMNARFSSAGLPGFHRTPRTGELTVSISPGEMSPTRVVYFAGSGGSIGDAAKQLPCGVVDHDVPMPEGVGSADAIEIFDCESEAERDARIALAKEQPAKTESKETIRLHGDDPQRRRAERPLVRFSTLDGKRRELPLPKRDCLRARLLARGHAPGAWFDPQSDGPEGRSRPGLAPIGGTLAWRIRDGDGDDDTPLPAKILVRGSGDTNDPDWGDDANDGAAQNFVYTLADGQLPVAPGSYQVSVHRGPEYSAHQQRVVVQPDKTATVTAKLRRVVDTHGFVSADLHVHAIGSWDAPTRLTDRVRSLVAVGLEVAVATDHNAVTDYGPTIEALGVGKQLTSLVGDEVTTEHTLLGHFNVFPLAAGHAPLAWSNAAPKRLFAAARRLSPDGVIQVNHPRMGDIGYFELLRMDRGAVLPWQRRTQLADVGFDAIEVFNGDHYADLPEVEWVMEDWFALLEGGIRRAATGNSDSHKAAFQEAGVPRNWVASAHDEPELVDHAAFSAAIRGARVIVSSGPFIRFRADEAGVGSELAAGEHELSIEVQAPDWIDVSKVELVKRGLVIRRWKVTGKAVKRFDEKLRLATAPGDWLLVVARGARPMPHLYRRGAKPFAFTNPIWFK